MRIKIVAWVLAGLLATLGTASRCAETPEPGGGGPVAGTPVEVTASALVNNPNPLQTFVLEVQWGGGVRSAQDIVIRVWIDRDPPLELHYPWVVGEHGDRSWTLGVRAAETVQLEADLGLPGLLSVRVMWISARGDREVAYDTATDAPDTASVHVRVPDLTA